MVEESPRKRTGMKVPVGDLIATGCNLDRKNPFAQQAIAHLPPTEIAAGILAKENRITDIIEQIQKLLQR